MVNKDRSETNKEDIEKLMYNFNKKFSKKSQETNTTLDHKKILKNFYRWMKFDSRDQRSVRDSQLKLVGLESKNQEKISLQTY